MPQKRFYRSRAHCNPLAHNDTFEYPITPSSMDWSVHYPNNTVNNDNDNKDDSNGDAATTTTKTPTASSSSSSSSVVTKAPTVLDIGCGFGGLTIKLATLLPDEVILGMEIRAKVCEYVRLRIVAHRKEHPGLYGNTSVLRTNSMKFLPHYFGRASLHKLFFCFPDPHFKRKNHGRRIVTTRLLSEYAYLLKPVEGRLYCVTDVKELHDWHVQHCDAHPLFERLNQDECKADPCVEAMLTTTEESQKVDRAGTAKHYAVYRRLPDRAADATEGRMDTFFQVATDDCVGDDGKVDGPN